MRTNIQILAQDFQGFRQWMKENAVREPQADWESDSSTFTSYRIDTFRLTLATCKEDGIDDHVKIEHIDVSGDYDNDSEVGFVYNSDDTWAERTKFVPSSDQDAVCRFEKTVETIQLAKTLRSSLTNNFGHEKKTRLLKI